MATNEKRLKKIERHIELGYRCKTCKKPLPRNLFTGRPENCEKCKTLIKKENL